MEFLLVIRHDEAFRPTDGLVSAIGAWIEEMSRRGIRVDGRPLRPPHEARTVRVRGGRLAVEGGAFGADRDRVAAYETIEAEDLEAAVAIAATHPMAEVATIEVREVWTELRTGRDDPVPPAAR